MADTETIATYNALTEDYASFTSDLSEHAVLQSFIAKIRTGGYVLDLGCGPAAITAVIRDMGHKVDPVDASAEMVMLANETHDIGARIATFDEIDGQNIYDGVWANFSLLHASPKDLPRHLKAIFNTLVPGGIFHIGMKEGSGTRRDRLGRLYAYYSQAGLKSALSDAGFEILDVATGEAISLAGDKEPWIAMTGLKPKAR